MIYIPVQVVMFVRAKVWGAKASSCVAGIGVCGASFSTLSSEREDDKQHQSQGQRDLFIKEWWMLDND